MTTGEVQDASAEKSNNSERPQPPSEELPRWKRVLILFGLCFALMLSSLETSIVATALVSISSSLGDYQSSNWVVVSYMLTYTGFMVVYARLSDVLGRKPMLLTAVGTFGLFSLGCGLVQNMTSLIILLAFQGMGASGIYSMVFAVMPEIVPIKWFGAFSGAIGAVYATSSILGPILGGVISDHSSWRWVFLLNVPCVAVIFLLLLLVYPPPPRSLKLHRGSLLQVALVGLFLLLSGSILIVFAVQQSSLTSWSSPSVLAPLIIGICVLPVFVAWETVLPRISIFQMKKTQPAFPLRLLSSRNLAAGFAQGFLFGLPFTTAIILLPTRYHIASSLPPLDAGLRMLPLLLSSALGSGLGGVFTRFRLGPTYAFLAGNVLALLGMGLMSIDASATGFRNREYGFSVILGLGFGMTLSTLVVISRASVGPEDSAVVMACLTQVRVLGGCVGLAVANAVVYGVVDGGLDGVLLPEQVRVVRHDAGTIRDLGPEVEKIVRSVYAKGFGRSWWVMLAITGVAALVATGVWSTEARSMEEVKEEQTRWEQERANHTSTAANVSQR